MSVAPLLSAEPAGQRSPGCTDACQSIVFFQAGVFGRQSHVLHDPRSHEQYGADCVVAEDRVVRTGCLAVDLGARTVIVDGTEVRLTSNELAIVLHFARRVGQIVTTREVVGSVWGPDYVLGDLTSYGHIMRTNLSRLRPKLGCAGPLLESVTGIGYRLVMAPTDAVCQPFVPLGRRSKRWAQRWPRCRMCGSDELPHHAHGVCRHRACQSLWRRLARQGAVTP